MDRLDQAVAESGRSLAQEIEDRLEFAFRVEDLLGGSERLVFMSFLASRISAIEEAYDADFTRDKAAWAEVKVAFDAALEAVYPPTKNREHLQSVIEDALARAESKGKPDGA
jgi:hypothetical protein